MLIFERLRVEEPQEFLTKSQIYADVYVKIEDEILAGNYINAKEVFALKFKLFFCMI